MAHLLLVLFSITRRNGAKFTPQQSGRPNFKIGGYHLELGTLNLNLKWRTSFKVWDLQSKKGNNIQKWD